MRRLHEERGSAVVFLSLFMTVLLGMSAIVVDVGGWFREQRKLQATADASTLAAVQALPDAGVAADRAMTYANLNGGGVAPTGIILSNTYAENDTITIVARRQAPGIFSRVLSVANVDIEARARARAGGASSVRNAAPIVVKEEVLACLPGCFDTTLITLKLNDEVSLSGGSFGLIDVAQSGDVNTTALVSWINVGFPGLMPAPEWYDNVQSAKFNASSFETALKNQSGRPLLFPVYNMTRSTPKQYHVIGWVGFVIRSSMDVKITGNCSNEAQGCFIRGYIARYLARGVLADKPPSYGMRVVALTG
jgi:hypothetical protein